MKTLDNKISVSFLIPVHNEIFTIKGNLATICKYLSQLSLLSDYEVLIIDNGSSDDTSGYLNNHINIYSGLKVITLREKGLGFALKEGFRKASKDTVCFFSIDVGFGLEHIKGLIETMLGGYDLAVGSKGHPDSLYVAPFQRKVFSEIYNFLLRSLFGITVRDTQGTFLIKRSKFLPFLDKLSSEGALFQSQLIIYATAYKLKICEIPVKYIAGSRKSRFNYTDAIKTLVELLGEYYKFIRSGN